MMTIGDLKELDGPPASELHLPMSEDEFLATVGDLRAEWANGEAIIMAPDNTEHSDLTSWLGSILRFFVDGHDLGRVYINNIQARLPIGTRRIPDISFVTKARLGLVQRTHLAGAPDLAVEVVSPDSVARDHREKHAEYEQSGVREYWIIDPAYERLDVFTLAAGSYRRIAPDGNRVRSALLAGFFIRPEWLWARPLPPVTTIVREIDSGT